MASLWTEVKQFVGNTLSLLGNAVLSRGWIYPLQGVVYLATHPSLHKALYPVLWQLVLSAAVVGVGLLLTLPIQSAFVFFLGPFAPIVALLFIAAEFCIAALILSKTLFADIQDSLFDAVLLQQGHDALVVRGRGVQGRPGGVKKLGASVTKPLKRITKDGILRYIVTIPLNFIPVAGTILFLALNGAKSGPSSHARYFQLKGLNKTQQEKFVHERQGAYTAFGIASLALGMIPFAGILFGFTSAVGAALWASNLEKKDGAAGSVSDGKQPAQERVEL